MGTSTKETKAKIEITTLRGISLGAKHYYGRILFMPEYEALELTRPIEQEEINSDPERFYYYEDGDRTNAFRSWKDVIEAGRKILKEKEIKEENVLVSGVPNNKGLLLSENFEEVDTRLKCTSCGCVITGAVYNYLSGAKCCECVQNERKNEGNSSH
jgi:hypothetical protein